MTEILFYHLRGQKLEGVLPPLLTKSLQRGWRVIVQGVSQERIEALDSFLWTYRDDSFLPHGTWQETEAASQPILLTPESDNPNNANVRFLIDGAPLPDDAASYQRLVVVFDGDDEEVLANARRYWTEAKASGHDATYWQADADGRWVKQA